MTEQQKIRRTLNDWLVHAEWLSTLPRTPGLARMREMITRLGIHFNMPIIMVGGTNGKGSTVTYVGEIAQAAGLKTALYTSPHVEHFTERARIDGKEVSENELIAALARVEAARDDLPLTYFEFTTLGILLTFESAHPDLVVLEIGLGGRLDAVNALDPTVSVFTSIGIDHTAILGATREAIAYEKAFILRAGCYGICSDPNPPETLLAYAAEIGAQLLCLGKDFSLQSKMHTDGTRTVELVVEGHAPLVLHPGLEGENQYRNAAAAVMALRALAKTVNDKRFDFSDEVINRGLRKARLTGRFERISMNPCLTLLDVGHNPEAAEVLAKNLRQSARSGERTLAVVGMLTDKDREGVLRRVAPEITEWFCTTLPGPRGGSAETLAKCLYQIGVSPQNVALATHTAQAFEMARSRAKALSMQSSDPVRILIFGSFHTVEEALKVFAREASPKNSETDRRKKKAPEA